MHRVRALGGSLKHRRWRNVTNLQTSEQRGCSTTSAGGPAGGSVGLVQTQSTEDVHTEANVSSHSLHAQPSLHIQQLPPPSHDRSLRERGEQVGDVCA